nr:DNA methyltransferase [Acidobacteriota bacterium]
MSYVVTQRRKVGADSNKLYPEDIPVHEWYRFVLSYPPHLVRDYIKRFGITKDQLVLDPFCGTGTTNVECKKLGIPSVGIEANLVAHFAGHVKINWNPDPDGLIKHASAVAESVLSALRTVGIEDDLFFTSNAGSLAYLRTLPPEVMKLMLTNSISPLPLHKVLVLIDQLKSRSDERYYHHEMLALAKALVCTISNLKFGPEVGIGRIKDDVSVIRTWLAGVQIMADDLRNVNHLRDVPAYI